MRKMIFILLTITFLGCEHKQMKEAQWISTTADEAWVARILPEKNLLTFTG